MTLRGLIMGITVWIPATLFASASRTEPDSAILAVTAAVGNKYVSAVRDAIERIESETERSAIEQIIAELAKKSERELLTLRLASHICQNIDCRGVSPDTVRHYVEVYAEEHVAEEAQQTALRNAAAAERSTLIATVSASVSFLLVSGLSFWRTVRSKSAIPA